MPVRGKAETLAETIGHAASRTELLRETSHSADPSGMPIAPGAGECIYRTVPVFIWTVRKLRFVKTYDHAQSTSPCVRKGAETRSHSSVRAGR